MSLGGPTASAPVLCKYSWALSGLVSAFLGPSRNWVSHRRWNKIPQLRFQAPFITRLQILFSEHQSRELRLEPCTSKRRERPPAFAAKTRYAPSETSMTRPAKSLPLSWSMALCAPCTVAISTNPMAFDMRVVPSVTTSQLTTRHTRWPGSTLRGWRGH
jgi:hypothetical protein